MTTLVLAANFNLYDKCHKRRVVKSISTIKLAIMENMECTIIKVHTTVIDIKVGASPKHGVSLRFVSLPAFQTLD